VCDDEDDDVVEQLSSEDNEDEVVLEQLSLDNGESEGGL